MQKLSRTLDAECIAKKDRPAQKQVGFGFFPCVAFEKTFVSTLTDYLKFAREVLKLRLPLKIMAGAANVKGYRMAAPGNPLLDGLDRFRGMGRLIRTSHGVGIIEGLCNGASPDSAPVF